MIGAPVMSIFQGTSVSIDETISAHGQLTFSIITRKTKRSVFSTHERDPASLPADVHSLAL
jgi:hypothetical protein